MGRATTGQRSSRLFLVPSDGAEDAAAGDRFYSWQRSWYLMAMTEAWGIKEWVHIWKSLGPVLEAERDALIKNSETQKSIEQLDWAFQYAKRNDPGSPTSGLVDFYRIVLRAKGNR
jgi:hypothetical protein